MGKFIDLTGQHFGRLTVLKRAPDKIEPSGFKRIMWECKCDCGNPETIIISGSHLKTGHTKSCGCLANESRSINGHKNKKYNTFDITGEYGIGYTLAGEKYYFDLEDYDKIKDICWFYRDSTQRGNNLGYLQDCNNLKLHRLVMGVTDPKIQVDHINHDTLDNRKINLRITNNSGNTRNRGLYKNNTSGVTGVNWDKTFNKWHSRISINGKYSSLGHYDDFDEAVKVRKNAEDKYYNEYSYDNSMKYAEQYKIEEEQCVPIN